MLDWADTAEAGLAPLVARNLVGLAGALVLLAVRDEHSRRTIETRLLEPLTREFSKVIGFDVTFGFVVDPELDVPIRFDELIDDASAEPSTAAETTAPTASDAAPAPARRP